MSIEEKLRKLYPDKDFRIGDSVTISGDSYREYYGEDNYIIRDFYVSKETGEILIDLNKKIKKSLSYGVHPTYLRNLSALRRKKMKNII